jgi:hypothetical protein
MRKLVCLGTIAVFAAICAPASAVITSSKLTVPADPGFFDPDLEAASQPLDVSGTATGSGSVDIDCVYDSGQFSASGVLATVPVFGGAFSATINLNDFYYSLCRLVAIDSDAVPPVNTDVFKGPVVGNSGFETELVNGDPYDGQLRNYFQASAAAKGYFSVKSAGECYVRDSYPVDPAALADDGRLWACSAVYQGDNPSGPTTQVDGEQAFLPYRQSPDRAGFRQIEGFTHEVDPADGLMRVSDNEPVVTCLPDKDTCTSFADPGITLHQKQTGGTNGHTLTVNHRWVNTGNIARQLGITYEVRVDDGNPGWRFAGDPDYTGYPAGTEINPPASGPGSFFVAERDSTCPGLSDPCGSFTWYDPPQAIVADDGGKLLLTYNRTIAPGASEVIAFTYSQGFPQSAVDGYAATAEQSFDTGFSFRKLKQNTTKGKATLAVRVPGSGDLHLEGKGLKTVNKAVSAQGAKLAPETVKLAITPKGKAKRQLKRRGKTKLSADVTYARDDLEPTVATKKLKLKRKKPPRKRR